MPCGHREPPGAVPRPLPVAQGLERISSPLVFPVQSADTHSLLLQVLEASPLLGISCGYGIPLVLESPKSLLLLDQSLLELTQATGVDCGTLKVRQELDASKTAKVCSLFSTKRRGSLVALSCTMALLFPYFPNWMDVILSLVMNFRKGAFGTVRRSIGMFCPSPKATG